MLKIRKIELYDTDSSETKSFDRFTYDGDFDQLILEHIKNFEIERYAELYLNMIDEDECPEECNCSVSDYSTFDLLEECKSRGQVLIPCETLTDTIRAEKLVELHSKL